MAIDASIYGQIQQPQIESPLNALAKVTQLKNAQSQNKLYDLKLADAESATASKNALNAAYQSSFDPATGAIDRNKLYTSLAQGGQGSSLPGIQKSFSDVDKSSADAYKSKLDGAAKQIDFVAQAMSAAKQNPAMYPQILSSLRAQFPGAGKDMPDQFDPAAVDAAITRAVSVKDQIAQKQKELEFQYRQQNDAANRSVTMRGQNMTDARGQQMIELQKDKINATGSKPLPTAALKLQQEDLDAIGTAASIKADLGSVLNQLQTGKLDLGPVANLVSQGRNAAGISSEQSRNFASFRATLEKLRNDSLRLNKGVQTDGDAQRAWNELFNNLSDKNVVAQRLKEIQKINERGTLLHKNNIDVIRSNYGKESLDTSGFEKVDSALGGDNAKSIDSLLEKYK